MLQGLLGSDDEEQEDPKDYCKGEAWPGAARGEEGPESARVAGGRAGPGRPGAEGKATPPPCSRGSLPQAATTL